VDEGVRIGDVSEGVSAEAEVPVILGENGDVIIGSGMVRRLRYSGVSEGILEGPLCRDTGLLVLSSVIFSGAVGCDLDFTVLWMGL